MNPAQIRPLLSAAHAQNPHVKCPDLHVMARIRMSFGFDCRRETAFRTCFFRDTRRLSDPIACRDGVDQLLTEEGIANTFFRKLEVAFEKGGEARSTQIVGYR